MTTPADKESITKLITAIESQAAYCQQLGDVSFQHLKHAGRDLEQVATALSETTGREKAISECKRILNALRTFRWGIAQDTSIDPLYPEYLSRMEQAIASLDTMIKEFASEIR